MKFPCIPRLLALSAFLASAVTTSTGAQTGAPGPQLRNFQHLVCNYSPQTGELAMALLPTSTRTDPGQAPQLADELAVQLELADGGTAVIGSQQLKTNVLGRYRADADRKYKLFRFNLVIDESNSIETPDLVEARRIIDGFLERIPVVYEAQVIRFSSAVASPSVFTNDVDSLRHALGRGTDRLTGGTDFYNALDRAVRELSQTSNEYPLQFTVAFTDGVDTSGRDFQTFLRSFRQSVEREQIFVFVAGIGTEGGIDHDLLRQVPGKMGIYYELSKVPDVDQVFDQVAQMLDKTYIVRVPTVAAHAGAASLFLLREKSSGSGHETLQDVALPARCIPP